MNRYRDEIGFIVALEGGHRFHFSIQGWDNDDAEDGRPISDSVALAMARGLLKSGVPIDGTYPAAGAAPGGAMAVDCTTIIDPARVVALFINNHAAW